MFWLGSQHDAVEKQLSCNVRNFKIAVKFVFFYRPRGANFTSIFSFPNKFLETRFKGRKRPRSLVGVCCSNCWRSGESRDRVQRRRALRPARPRPGLPACLPRPPVTLPDRLSFRLRPAGRHLYRVTIGPATGPATAPATGPL